MITAGRCIICLWLLCIVAGVACAEHLPVRIYTAADGLSSSAVDGILRDSRGFMWFATRDGLSRFDGQRFVTYRFGQSSSPSVTQILERQRGDYLVVMQSGGVYRFDSQTPVTASSGIAGENTLELGADLLADAVPGTIYEDHRGRLWATSVTDGLFLLDEYDKHLVWAPVELLPEGQHTPITGVSHMVEAHDRCLWLITNQGLMRRFEDGRAILYSAALSTPIGTFLTTVFEDGDGRIWAGSRRGVYVLQPLPLSDPSAFLSRTLRIAKRDADHPVLPAVPGEVVEFTQANGFYSEMVLSIYQTADGRVWLTSKGGLSVFDGQSFSTFNAENGLAPKLGAMTEDIDGNLWFASLNGAVKLVTHGLSTYRMDDGLGDRTIRSMYQGPDGNFFVVNGDWVVSQLQGKRFVTARPRLAERGTPVWTSNVGFLDRTGAWWFLTERQLFRFDQALSVEQLARRRPAAIYPTGPEFHNGAFYFLFEDSRGDVWVSTRSAAPANTGLSLWNRAKNSFYTFGAADDFPTGRAVSAFCEDRAGTLWVGFYYGDVARYAHGKFKLLTSKDGLPEGFVTAIHSDKIGRLWIASTGGGVTRVDDPEAEHPVFVNYSTKNGLSSNNARAITEDAEGRIYVGTVRGVDRLSPDTGRVRRYTMADGLADDFITAAFRDQDGALWFGTQNGLSRLYPEPDLAANAPPIMIGALRVAGVKQKLSELGQTHVEQLQLNYTQANLQIDFFSLSFAPAESVRYQHKLEGADKDWSAPASERTVTYANLAPGSYRFLVRAVNADGLSSIDTAVVPFRIAPPVWSQGWFIWTAILLFGAGMYWVARARFVRKLELERVRTRIATDLHDDIGASLTRIAMLSEVTKAENRGVHPASAHRLTQIADDARTLVDSMSDIVWAIDPRRDDFLSVVERVRSFAADTLGTAGVRWQLTVAPELETHRLTPEQRRALYLIFKEAIINIARHSECRNASCVISFEHSTLFASIEDDGRGVEHEQKSNGRGGRGLVNMAARAAQIGGRLAVEQLPQGGTRLLLTLPLRAASMNMFLRMGRG